MTVNRTWIDPSDGGTLDIDTGGVLTETAYDGILSGLKNLGSTDSGKARVTTQFDKTDTSLANVTGLSLAVEAGGVYAFRAVLHLDMTGTGGAKVAIAGTATATAIIYSAHSTPAVTGFSLSLGGQATALGSGVGANGTAGDGIVYIEGLITVNAAGTLVVQFAENSANGTSSVLVGSTFQVWVYA